MCKKKKCTARPDQLHRGCGSQHAGQHPYHCHCQWGLPPCMGRWLTPHHNRGSLADGQHVRSPASGLILAQSACCPTAAGTRTCGLPLCAQSVGLRPCPLEVRVRSQPAGTFRRVVSVPAPLRASCQWSTYPQGSPRLLVIDGFFALRNACVFSLKERCSTWKAADAANSIWGPILAPKMGPKTYPKLGAPKRKQERNKWNS